MDVSYPTQPRGERQAGPQTCPRRRPGRPGLGDNPNPILGFPSLSLEQDRAVAGRWASCCRPMGGLLPADGQAVAGRWAGRILHNQTSPRRRPGRPGSGDNPNLNPILGCPGNSEKEAGTKIWMLPADGRVVSYTASWRAAIWSHTCPWRRPGRPGSGDNPNPFLEFPGRSGPRAGTKIGLLPADGRVVSYTASWRAASWSPDLPSASSWAAWIGR